MFCKVYVCKCERGELQKNMVKHSQNQCSSRVSAFCILFNFMKRAITINWNLHVVRGCPWNAFRTGFFIYRGSIWSGFGVLFGSQTHTLFFSFPPPNIPRPPQTVRTAFQELQEAQRGSKGSPRGPKVVPKRVSGGPKRLP